MSMALNCDGGPGKKASTLSASALFELKFISEQQQYIRWLWLGWVRATGVCYNLEQTSASFGVFHSSSPRCLPRSLKEFSVELHAAVSTQRKIWGVFECSTLLHVPVYLTLNSFSTCSSMYYVL